MATRTRALALLALLAWGASCARVRPWQREDLSRRAMTSEEEQPGEARFEQHVRTSREGAEGGTGQAGGGCGCN